MNQWKQLDNNSGNTNGPVYALAVPNGSIALKYVGPASESNGETWGVVFCIRKNKQFTPVFSREFEANSIDEAQKTALWQVISAVGARSDFWSKAFRALIDAVAPPNSDTGIDGEYSAPNSEGKIVYHRAGYRPDEEAEETPAVALDCDIPADDMAGDTVTAGGALDELQKQLQAL